MRRVLTILILALALAACIPAPSPSPDNSESRVATSVALTVNAQNQMATNVALTLTAQAPGITNTPTFIPGIDTPIAIPTITPIPPIFIPTATPFSVNPTAGSGPKKYEYACDVIRVRPHDNTEMNRGQHFDIKWTVMNVGTKAWVKGKDLKYKSGPLMTSVTRIELPYMGPGDKFSVVFDAVAPDTRGFHVMTWAIDGPVCYPYVAIIVK